MKDNNGLDLQSIDDGHELFVEVAKRHGGDIFATYAYITNAISLTLTDKTKKEDKKLLKTLSVSESIAEKSLLQAIIATYMKAAGYKSTDIGNGLLYWEREKE